MCAKLVLNRNKYDSSISALKDLHWLPVRARIHFKILSLMHQFTYEKSPSYLSELFQEKQLLRCLIGNTCAVITYVVPNNRKKTFADRSFSTAGPLYWNELPHNIRKIQDFNVFKKRCKAYLYVKYFL